VFSDNMMKRRRMREMILSQSSRDNERESKMKQKENKKKQNLKIEQQKE